MSLIDEALRKASDQAGRGATPIEPSSWVPAYGLDRRARRRRGALIAGLIAAAAAGAAAYWLAARTSASKPRIVVAAPAARPAPAASPLPEVMVSPPPGSAIGRGNTVNAIKPPGEARTARESVQPQIRATAEAPSSIPSTAGARPKTESAPPQASARPPAEVKTYKGEVSLPGGGKITLDGIAYSEAHPVAVLNGRVLESGSIVEEFTLVRIEPDRVTLSGRGMTIFLALK